FGIGSDSVLTLRDEVVGGDRRNMPGAVRMSFGFYSTRDDVDAIIQALWDIQNGKWRGDYTQNPNSGEYKPTSEQTSPVGWFNI
ncbi:MAG TPA: hypothetical protein VF826_07315, partial [Chloroflexia bacterium]